MSVHYNSVFYAHVGALSPRTLQLLPLAKKGTQKIVVGDKDGVLSCFSIKKGEPSYVFKTLPGSGISRLDLGGAPGAAREKIFYSAGVEVFGYSKKGKQFLRFDTNLTEGIQNIFISGVDLFVSGKNIYNHFEDCKDTDYYLCSDRINDVLCLSPEKTEVLSPVLACQDCALRLLKASELVYEVEVPGPPKCTTLYDQGQFGREDVLYGTQNGKIGLVQLGADEPVYHWDLDNDRREGGVTCMAVQDVLLDGAPDILVGRDDGIVQLFSLDEADQPVLKFSHSYPESISSVEAGYVSSVEHKEIVVSTYNGQITGLTSRTGRQQAEVITAETKTKITALKTEIVQLEEKIKVARERYKENITSSDKDMISAIPKFDINDKFSLNQDEAWYTLSIETQVPLDTIVIQSNVPLDIQEVDKSVAVVSYTPPDVAVGNFVLVTYRLNGASRLEVKIRTIEGQHGTVQAYIIPSTEPKTCILRTYSVNPLSLHQRIHNFDDSRPYNTLSIAGSFTLGEAHAWLRHCLLDVPEHLPVDEEATLYFKGVFTGTQLECSYKQGSLAFRTDNMSTLTVLKDALTKEATERNVVISINFVLNQDSVPHMLQLVFPLLEHQLMLAKNVQLIEALQEIKIAEQDISFMPPQWKLILDNAELIQSEFKMQPCMVERIYALITDLYMDRANFKGENVKSKVPQLLETLEGCELDSILAFFEAS